jgi:hypothetical protein
LKNIIPIPILPILLGFMVGFMGWYRGLVGDVYVKRDLELLVEAT